jgi:hypothetical protein
MRCAAATERVDLVEEPGGAWGGTRDPLGVPFEARLPPEAVRAWGARLFN